MRLYGGIEMFINYDYYRIFYYVAKYGSFTQAANVLMENQSNITRIITNLETELGCELFVRTNKGATLTPEGEKLLVHVNAAAKELQLGEEEISAGKGLESGTITVSVSETALHGLLLKVLHKFTTAYPGIKIRILNFSTPQAISSLHSGIADLAIVTSPTGSAKPLQETRIKTFSELLVCGPEYSDMKYKRLRFEDLQSYQFICLGRDTKTFEFYNKLFSKEDLVLSPDMEAATTDQLLMMVKNNLGLGFLPDIIARPAIEAGEIQEVKFDDPIPKRYICILKNTENSLSAAAKEFEKTVLEERDSK